MAGSSDFAVGFSSFAFPASALFAGASFSSGLVEVCPRAAEQPPAARPPRTRRAQAIRRILESTTKCSVSGWLGRCRRALFGARDKSLHGFREIMGGLVRPSIREASSTVDVPVDVFERHSPKVFIVWDSPASSSRNRCVRADLVLRHQRMVCRFRSIRRGGGEVALESTRIRVTKTHRHGLAAAL